MPRKAVLIWHKHIMDNPPATPDVPPNVPAQPWPYLSMYMLDIDASTDMTYVFTCELCKPKTTKISTSKKSSDESPTKCFQIPTRNPYPKPTLVSQPVQHVSSSLVLENIFLVPNRTGCLIKTLRDCSCVISTSDSALASSSSA